MKNFAKILFALLLFAGINNAFAATEDRHITGFNSISVSGSFDVYITQGSTESVKVEAPESIIDKIKTEVVDGELKIYNRNDNGWNFSWFGNNNRKRVVIYISAKDLNAVGQLGSGNMYFKNGIRAGSIKLRVSGSGNVTGLLNAKELEASVSGSGDMKLTGHASITAVRVSGSGNYSAGELVTDNTSVHVSGSGDASVNVNEKLDASASGSGDVKYTGNVKNVSSSKSGSGSVRRF